MHTVVQRIWSALEDESWQHYESSIEPGRRAPGLVDDDWGRSESVDPDDVGDIADEGIAHRG
jgi:hypothetical protein